MDPGASTDFQHEAVAPNGAVLLGFFSQAQSFRLRKRSRTVSHTSSKVVRRASPGEASGWLSAGHAPKAARLPRVKTFLRVIPMCGPIMRKTEVSVRTKVGSYAKKHQTISIAMLRSEDIPQLAIVLGCA
jgi:hypothetical protein